MSLGFRLEPSSRVQIAGKISELCLIGPEKLTSPSIFSPTAIATEPILPEVSTDNVKGFCTIFLFFWQAICYVFFRLGLITAMKKAFFKGLFFPHLSRIYQFAGL